MQMDNSIKTNYELRRISRAQLKGNWGTAILLYLILFIISIVVIIIPIIGWIAGFIIAGSLMLGLTTCFLRLVREESLRFEDLFNSFSNFKTSFLAYLLILVFTLLWTLVFLIPGFIAILRYSMTFYILHDNPEMGTLEAIRASKKMMAGYKLKLFFLYFSFHGWAILCSITLGIGYLWLTPYMQTAMTNFYQNLKDAKVSSPEEIIQGETTYIMD